MSRSRLTCAWCQTPMPSDAEGRDWWLAETDDPPPGDVYPTCPRAECRRQTIAVGALPVGDFVEVTDA